MKKACFSSTLLSAALATGWGLTAPASWAVDTFTATTAAKKDKSPQRPHGKARQPPSDRGSGESKTERDKRLLRECRGRPNAGACEGYAS